MVHLLLVCLLIQLLDQLVTQLIAKQPRVLLRLIVIILTILISIVLVLTRLRLLTVLALVDLLLSLELLLVELILVLLQSGITIEVVVVTDLVTHGMHHDIDSDDLIELADSQLAECLYNTEVDVAGAGDPKCNGDCTYELDADLSKVGLGAGDQSVLTSEDADVE